MSRALALRRALLAPAMAAAALAAGCATDGAAVGVYGAFGYDEPWYWGDCCYDYPGGIGPPLTPSRGDLAVCQGTVTGGW